MTIEERANHKADVSQYRSDYIYDRQSVKIGYIEGATDQKAIDIDKACDWIDKQWDYITEERRSEIKEMFRKAMED